jgi:2-succinyl-6-hydroxy-2,4-cyclohexadiene-1-carboxylate synthase
MINIQRDEYHLMGERHNPPVVFLHGFMGAGADWLQIAEVWANQFFCIMPDLPGHGNYTHLPISQPLDFDFVVKDLELFLKQLKLDRVSLVGYSLGGRIALYAAMKFPEKISALVLESCHAGLADEQTRRDRAEADDKRAETLLVQGIETFVDQWYELDLFGTLKSQPPLLAEIKEKRKKNDPGWMAKIIKELSPGRQPPLWEKLGSLPLPVLLIAGGLDSKYTELAIRMGRQLPNAMVEIIPNVGHNVHLENPGRFGEVVTVFLQEKLLC